MDNTIRSVGQLFNKLSLPNPTQSGGEQNIDN